MKIFFIFYLIGLILFIGLLIFDISLTLNNIQFNDTYLIINITIITLIFVFFVFGITLQKIRSFE